MAYGDVYHKVANERGSVDVAVDLGDGMVFKLFTDPDTAHTEMQCSDSALKGMTLIHEAPKK